MGSNGAQPGSRHRTAKVVEAWSRPCAAEIAVAVLGGAWKPTILQKLDHHRVVRFGELTRMLGDPTPRVLTKQLRELEQDGLVRRTVYAEVPPRVEYSLTDIGRSAQDLLGAMTAWGAEYSRWHRNRAESR
ncbi:helix-turn-helix transcriptional regulator [Mycobacterium sp. DSM 3803]|nr:helix-turn-helix transcriptional regulator [Mycobacterium sp. DSM 3803]